MGNYMKSAIGVVIFDKEQWFAIQQVGKNGESSRPTYGRGETQNIN